MRILVSGGAGFIGSHFVKRLLRAGDDVVVLDKLTYCGNRANLAGRRRVPPRRHRRRRTTWRALRAGCDAIVNFAAETHVDRSILTAEDFGRTEFRGTQVLLEHIREAGIRLVQVSTDEVYGDLEAGGSSKETDPLRPSSPYSAAKAAGDLLDPGVRAHVRRQRVDHARLEHVRAESVPGEVHPALRHERARRRGAAAVRRRKQVRDWLYVEDHCAGIELVLREGAPGEIYNVGGGDELENIDGRRADPRADRRRPRRCCAASTTAPGHDRRYSLDTTKLEGLGWAPQTPFETGLRETVAWYRDHRDWWEPIKSGEYREYYERQYADRLANATL